MLSLFFRYIRHLLISGHRKGRGIHSPYLFSFISEVIYNRRITIPVEIDRWHRRLFSGRKKIVVQEFGAGSAITSSGRRSIGSIARWSSVSLKSGKLLFRIAQYYQPDKIFELGTGLGISTAWLAKGYPSAKVISVEGSPQKAGFARDQIDMLGLSNVTVLTANFDDILSDLSIEPSERIIVFLDGNHRYEPTMRYLNHFLDSTSKEMLIILDDIHWSGEMEQAWREIRGMERVNVMLDLFFMGLIFTREGLNRQDFLLRWG